MSVSPLPTLALHGVDHTARPTWRLRETVEFYRDKLGLPLVHVISARGWGPTAYPDFLHFFFDSGAGSAIAFFYYLGPEEPAGISERAASRAVPANYMLDSTHTAWQVSGPQDLKAWQERLEAHGLQYEPVVRHEVIESLVVRDPNGYFIEFTNKLRPLSKLDALDAQLSLEAAMALEDEARSAGHRVESIDAIWNRKAAMVAEREHTALAKVRVFVARVDEFAPLVRAAEKNPDCRVSTSNDYHVIEADGPIEFERKVVDFRPALWYGMLTGGVQGRIERYDRDVLRIVPQS